MSYGSSLRVVLMSMVGLVAVGLVTTYGGNKAAADPNSGDRLGCGTYCQSAGGYGAAGGGPTTPAVTIVSSGTVTTDADGYAPVTVKCDLSTQCSGALLFCLHNPDPALSNMGMAGYCGRSDLLVNAGATRTIGVPFPAAALASLRSHGPNASYVTAALAQPVDGFKNVSTADLTVAASG